jgi:hypothetical protein
MAVAEEALFAKVACAASNVEWYEHMVPDFEVPDLRTYLFDDPGELMTEVFPVSTRETN